MTRHFFVGDTNQTGLVEIGGMVHSWSNLGGQIQMYGREDERKANEVDEHQLISTPRQISEGSKNTSCMFRSNLFNLKKGDDNNNHK